MSTITRNKLIPIFRSHVLLPRTLIPDWYLTCVIYENFCCSNFVDIGSFDGCGTAYWGYLAKKKNKKVYALDNLEQFTNNGINEDIALKVFNLSLDVVNVREFVEFKKGDVREYILPPDHDFVHHDVSDLDQKHIMFILRQVSGESIFCLDDWNTKGRISDFNEYNSIENVKLVYLSQRKAFFTVNWNQQKINTLKEFIQEERQFMLTDPFFADYKDGMVKGV